MAVSSSRWSESWRVLAYSAAAAAAFIALEWLEFALFDFVGPDRWLTITRGKAEDDRLAAEATDVAARSRSAVVVLPPGHRLAAFRLGYELAWASELSGSFAMSDPRQRARAMAIADAHVAVAREQARRIGLDGPEVVALPARTVTDFARLQERFEADESGVARRVEARLTPIHRHLFLLGATVGIDAEMVLNNRGELSGAHVESIRRHATLAGVAPAVWHPLVVDHSKEPATVVFEKHRAAVEAMMAALAGADADPAASAPR